MDEINSYVRSKKDLTISQIEVILLKNKIRLPEQSYNKKRIAEIKFKEQLITNTVLTVFLIGFVVSLITVRQYIKLVTNQIKFTHVAKEYKSNFQNNTKSEKFKSKKQQGDNNISIDTQLTLNLFENLKYDLDSIRSGQTVKPIYLSITKRS